jgi:hypothetical protein
VFELATRPGPHQWKIYDEKHRGCTRCGLRLFWTSGAYGSRGWVLVTGDGELISRVLGDGYDVWGRCEPPTNTSAELVVVEYTGDPDNHPGCERFIHRLTGGELERGRSGPGLVELGAMLPACGWHPMFWEIAPARIHHGWTWCGDCFPGKGPTAADCHPGRRRHAADWDPGEMRPRNRNPAGPLLPWAEPRRLAAPAPKARQLPPKKRNR